MDLYDDVKCSKCGKDVQRIDLFPGGICLECHEQKFNASQMPTAEAVKAAFVNTINFKP